MIWWVDGGWVYVDMRKVGEFVSELNDNGIQDNGCCDFWFAMIGQ